MFKSSIKSGDVVVYRKHKHTTHPGPRARQVHASPKGDCYNYIIDKFWIVGQVLSDGRLLLRTRGGKTHVIDYHDPNLRRATFWDRLRHPTRFGQLQQVMSDPVSNDAGFHRESGNWKATALSNIN